MKFNFSVFDIVHVLLLKVTFQKCLFHYQQNLWKNLEVYFVYNYTYRKKTKTKAVHEAAIIEFINCNYERFCKLC